MITVSGVGPGNIKYLTQEVKERIQNAERIIAFKRIAQDVVEIRKDVIEISKVSELIPLITSDTAILASGDSLFFGVTDYLMRSGVDIEEVHPGITSYQYMMSKLKMPYNNANIFSMHGRDGDLTSVKNHPLSIILTDAENTPDTISKDLFEMNVLGSIIAGYNLSYEDEMIIEKKIGESFNQSSILAVVVIKNEMV